MAPLITTDDVQAWFTDDRLLLDQTDDLPEEPNVSREVTAKCSTRYDVSTWISSATTPLLIRSVISARVAAIRYRKHYADQLEELTYSDWLDEWYMMTLDGIINGTIPLTDVPADELLIAQEAASTEFFPTDLSSVEEPAKFNMAMEF